MHCCLLCGLGKSLVPGNNCKFALNCLNAHTLYLCGLCLQIVGLCMWLPCHSKNLTSQKCQDMVVIVIASRQVVSVSGWLDDYGMKCKCSLWCCRLLVLWVFLSLSGMPSFACFASCFSRYLYRGLPGTWPLQVWCRCHTSNLISEKANNLPEIESTWS